MGLPNPSSILYIKEDIYMAVHGNRDPVDAMCPKVGDRFDFESSFCR
jgi:hypothetical protein